MATLGLDISAVAVVVAVGSAVGAGSVVGGGLEGAVDGWAAAGSWAFIASGAGFFLDWVSSSERRFFWRLLGKHILICGLVCYLVV